MIIEPDSGENDGERFLFGGLREVTPQPGTALLRLDWAPPPPPRPKRSRSGLRVVVWGMGLLVAMGCGAFGLEAVRSSMGAPASAERVQADASAQVLKRLEDEVGRLKGSVDSLRASADVAKQDDSLRGLRRSVESLKQEIDQVKVSDGSNLAQLSSKIEKVDHDPSQKLAEIMNRLEKLDRDGGAKASDGTATQKLAEVQNRLDRVERQVSSQLPTGSIPTATHAAAVSSPTHGPIHGPVPTPVPLPGPAGKPASAQNISTMPQSEARAPAKHEAVDGWVLRDVYDGLALVEARGGSLREIAPGEYLPGAGEIRSIERHNGSWVVLTSRGVIENSTW